MRVAAIALLGLALACSCTSAVPPRETILREVYDFTKASAALPSISSESDTTAFVTYAAAATADTGAWNATTSAWKQMRAFYSSILGQLGYGTGPFTWRYGTSERT